MPLFICAAEFEEGDLIYCNRMQGPRVWLQTATYFYGLDHRMSQVSCTI